MAQTRFTSPVYGAYAVIPFVFNTCASGSTLTSTHKLPTGVGFQIDDVTEYCNSVSGASDTTISVGSSTDLQKYVANVAVAVNKGALTIIAPGTAAAASKLTATAITAAGATLATKIRVNVGGRYTSADSNR